jgi:hypothetical protein
MLEAGAGFGVAPELFAASDGSPCEGAGREQAYELRAMSAKARVAERCTAGSFTAEGSGQLRTALASGQALTAVTRVTRRSALGRAAHVHAPGSVRWRRPRPSRGDSTAR